MKVSALHVSTINLVEKYQISATLGDLQQHKMIDPCHLSTLTELDRIRTGQQSAFDMRGKNQRVWDKGRKSRRDTYATYIEGVNNGTRLGGFPSITMWTVCDAHYNEVEHELHLPTGALIAANDGETQLSAHFKIAEDNPAHLDTPLAIILYTNANHELADQQLYDANFFSVPIKEMKMATHNREGALTKALFEAIEVNSVEKEHVNFKGSTLQKLKVGYRYRTVWNWMLFGAIGVMSGEAVFSNPPSRLITKANCQGGTLDDPATLAAFFAAMYAQSESVLWTLNAEMYMAMGAFFKKHNRLPVIPHATALGAAITSAKGSSKSLARQIKAGVLYKTFS